MLPVFVFLFLAFPCVAAQSFETWEISVVAGLGGLCLLLLSMIIYLRCFRAKAKATNPIKPKQTALPTIREVICGPEGCAAPNGVKFPKAWGSPPAAAKDELLVVLPGKYGEGPDGKGPTSLKKWILSKELQAAREKLKMFPGQTKEFPKAWFTAERRKANPVPDSSTFSDKTCKWRGGYGVGPCELNDWVNANINLDIEVTKTVSIEVSS